MRCRTHAKGAVNYSNSVSPSRSVRFRNIFAALVLPSHLTNLGNLLEESCPRHLVLRLLARLRLLVSSALSLFHLRTGFTADCSFRGHAFTLGRLGRSTTARSNTLRSSAAFFDSGTGSQIWGSLHAGCRRHSHRNLENAVSCAQSECDLRVVLGQCAKTRKRASTISWSWGNCISIE